MKNILFTFLLFLITGITCFSQTFQIDTLLRNGNKSRFINLAVLGDGYTSTEQSKFITDANSLINYLFTQSPFKEYKNYFNVYAIRVISQQTGAKHPGIGQPDCGTVPISNPNNYLGTTFDVGGIHRLLTPNNTTVSNVLIANLPEFDQGFVISNTTGYGGAGGQFATTSLATEAFEIAVHEIGHSFATLSDEYWPGPQYAFEKPNLTTQSNPSLVKWKNWIGQTFPIGTGGTGTVGVYFAGVGSTANWYKPGSSFCLMEAFGRPFCPVCKEAIIEKIHSLVNPIISHTSNASTITTTNQFIDLKLLNYMKPSPNTFKILWRINGTIVNRNVDSIKVNQLNLNTGTNTVSVTLEDTSSMLRVDNHSTLHSYTINWNINKTIAGYPIMTTTNISSLTSTSVQSGGNVTSDGGFAVTARGVVWSTSPNPRVNLATKTVNGSGTGVFTSSITGLTPGTTYYLVAYATNSNGTSYGDQITFTTQTIPTITTTNVTSILTLQASSGGNVTSDGGASVTARGVVWSTSPNPTIALTTKTSNGTGTGTFTSSITGLTGNTLYYVRAYATNSVGTGYGNEVTFTTLPAGLVSLTTNPITLLGCYNVTTGGTIASDGGSAITSKGVCWSTTPNPTTSLSTKTSNGTGISSFSSQVNNLTPLTTYYIRAYAVNGNGTSYGNEITFTTSALPIITTSPPNVDYGRLDVPYSLNLGTNTSINFSSVMYGPTSPVTQQNKTSDGTTASSPISSNYISGISNLSNGTSGFVRAYVQDQYGNFFNSSNNESYTIPTSKLPVCTTLVVRNIKTTTTTRSEAVVEYQTLDLGDQTLYFSGGIILSTSPIGTTTAADPNKLISPTFPCESQSNSQSLCKQIQVVTLNFDPVQFPSKGLVPNTTYYVRAYASNRTGFAYGNQLTFTTPPYVYTGVPLVTTNAVTNITSTGATFSGTVTNNGGTDCSSFTSCRGWHYSTTNTTPTTSDLSTSEFPIVQTLLGTFTKSITGLSPNTTYYVRSFAINQSGKGLSTNVVSFTTLGSATTPTLTTTTPTSIGTTTATSGGNITSDGGASVTARGVVWSTSQNPTIALTTKTSNGTGTGTFTSSITGLLANTTYYIRAYATNSVGTSYGSQSTITTLSSTSVPTLTTTAVSSISFTTATSGGNITSDGGASVTARGICYATTQNPTTANTIVSSGTGTGTFTSNLTGLTPNTTYYVRAYATNSIGTAYGSQVSFTTSALVLPTLTSTDISNLSSTSATSGGNITSDGGASVTARGVCYATTPLPTTANSIVVSGGGVGTFTSNITGLTQGVTYYLRAYATNSVGTEYGNEITFTTLDLPQLTTTAATTILSTTATSGGNITSDGGSSVTTRGVCYGTTPNPTLSNFFSSNGSGIGTFTANLSLLNPNTLYYVRAFATNSVGTQYGNQITFTTLTTPTLTTTAITNITPTSATSGGNVTATGGSPITAQGVCWSTNPNPTNDLSTQTSDGTTSPFTSNITNLSPSTTYYVRSYGVTSVGVGYGNQITFTTASIAPPTITTTSVTTFNENSATMGGNVTNGGGGVVTRRGICYATTQNPDTLRLVVNIGAGTGSFSQNVGGLTPGVTYYVRAFAINSAGITYGTQVSFKTFGPPEVTTTATSNVSSTSIQTGGNVTSNGGGSLTVTDRGVCWSTTTIPTISNSVVPSGSGTGSFTSVMSNLTPGQTYYIRAYATNSLGTAYGNQITQQALNSPTVTTTAATSISTTFFTTGGNVTDAGGGSLTVIERGVVYSTNPTPTTSNSKVTSGTGTGSFSVTITSLTPGTTYYVRAYAINSVGTSYGSEISVLTSNVPVLTTSNITAISTNSATSGGTIQSSSGSNVTARGVCWSTSTNPTIALTTKTSDGTGLGTFSSSITGLSAGTTYYIRSYATNSSGTGYGNELTFTTTTAGTLATVTTTSASSITTSGAISGGNVTNSGGLTVTARGICYSTSPTPTISNSVVNSGSGTGIFTSTLSGLTSNTTYYLRSFATNATGTAYGNEITFTTLQVTSQPTVTTLVDAQTLTSTSVTAGGNVVSDGGQSVTSRGICYSTSSGPTISTGTVLNSGSGLGTYNISVTGLITGTTYYFRAFATNSNGTSYGSEVTITTLSLPVLTTTSASSILSTSANSGGNITSDGGASVTARGVCYSTSQNPTLSNTVTSNGVGTGSFVSNLTGLTASTLYYVRAYATNSVGTAYGNQVSFTTSSSGNSCVVQNLSAYKLNNVWYYRWQVNPTCSTYTVSLSRLQARDPNVQPTTSTPIEATGVRESALNANTCGCVVDGFVDKRMTQAPATTGYWYSVNVKCNATGCVGPNETRAFFWVP